MFTSHWTMLAGSWESVVSWVRTQHGLKVKSGLYVYTGPGGAVVQGWHNPRLSLVNCLLILACDWLVLSHSETWHIPGTLYSILYMISGGCKPSVNGTFVLSNEEEARSYFLTHSLIHGLCNIRGRGGLCVTESVWSLGPSQQLWCGSRDPWPGQCTGAAPVVSRICLHGTR